MPELITETLLVVESFKNDAEEYDRGDRLPVGHRWVRRIAAEDDSEARYQAVLRAREERKVRHERAQRDELEEQNRAQPDPERRYRKQEADREREREGARGAREGESRTGRRASRRLPLLKGVATWQQRRRSRRWWRPGRPASSR